MPSRLLGEERKIYDVQTCIHLTWLLRFRLANYQTLSDCDISSFFSSTWLPRTFGFPRIMWNKHEAPTSYKCSAMHTKKCTKRQNELYIKFCEFRYNAAGLGHWLNPEKTVSKPYYISFCLLVWSPCTLPLVPELEAEGPRGLSRIRVRRHSGMQRRYISNFCAMRSWHYSLVVYAGRPSPLWDKMKD